MCENVGQGRVAQYPVMPHCPRWLPGVHGEYVRTSYYRPRARALSA
jgi:hypothetical protein